MTQHDVPAVDAFWRWWSGRYREVLGAAIDEDRVEEVVAPLFARLGKVHPELICDLRPGATSRVALVIGARGECPEDLVVQLLAAAPEPDEQWEYGPADAPIADPRVLTLKAGDRSIDLARMQVGLQVDDEEMVAALDVYHPELGDLPAEHRDSVATTALNAVAGHAPPLRHRTRLRLTCTPPEGAVDLAELRVRLADLDP
ncbi:MAG: hypothetical protein ACRDRZ_04170 [Pseudonocardiaceae bacterium]